MITRIEATRYRCFDKLDVELGEFRVLVGANGSGKTTLLDVPLLLADLLRERTISEAFTEQRDGRAPRATALRELIFQGLGDNFILAVEAALPERVTSALIESLSERGRDRKDQWPTHIRYELRLQLFNETELQVQNEYLFVFPEPHAPTRAMADASAPRMYGEFNANRNWKFILRREYGGETEYTPETARRPRSTKSMTSPQQLALPRVQFESQSDFPAARWLYDMLVEDSVFFNPDWDALRVASPPGLSKTQVLGDRRAHV